MLGINSSFLLDVTQAFNEGMDHFCTCDRACLLCPQFLFHRLGKGSKNLKSTMLPIVDSFEDF